MYLPDLALQNQTALLSVGFGTLLGLVYDVFRLFRLACGRKRGVFWQDLLFFVVAAFLTVLFLLTVNRGSLRLFILLAMAVGFFIYYFTFSRLVMRGGTLLFSGMRRLLLCLAGMLSAPLRLLLLIFAFLRRKVGGFAKKHKKDTCKNPDM